MTYNGIRNHKTDIITMPYFQCTIKYIKIVMVYIHFILCKYIYEYVYNCVVLIGNVNRVHSNDNMKDARLEDRFTKDG